MSLAVRTHKEHLFPLLVFGLKGQFTLHSNMQFSPLTCVCVCLLLNQMEQDGTCQKRIERYIALLARGKICIFDFGINCHFKSVNR